MFRKFIFTLSFFLVFFHLVSIAILNAAPISLSSEYELFAILKQDSEESAINYLNCPVSQKNLNWLEQLFGLCRPRQLKLEVTNSYGDTFLNIAATLGYSKLVQELLFRSANIHHKNHKGNTALIMASTYGNEAVIKILLASGANVNDKNYSRETALGLAAQNGYLEVLNILLDYGADLNHQTKLLNSPLMMALKNGQTDTSTRLVESGANIHLINKFGINALIYAVTSEKTELVELILSYHPDINHSDIYGRNSSYHAVSINSVPIISLLLKAGIDINQEYSDHFTPLTLASHLGHLSTILFLLDNGAKINFQSSGGKLVDVFNHKWRRSPIKRFYNYYKKFLSLNTYMDLMNFESEIRALKEKHPIDPSIENSVKAEDWLIEKVRKIAPKLYIFEEEVSLASRYKLYKKCPVCLDEYHVSQAECFGPAKCNCYLCPECTNYFLEFLLYKGKGDIIKCPGCHGLIQSIYLTQNEVKPQQIEQFFLHQIHLLNASQPHWVSCPTADCTGGRIMLPNEGQYLHCGLCGFEKCLKCGENHRGHCTEAKREISKTEEWIYHLLEQGYLPPPPTGHPNDPNDSTYYNGRYRPCYHCGLVTERESDGTQNSGQCNSMICARCKNKWHWNYGSHKGHPKIRPNQEEIHDFNRERRQYEPLQVANF